METYQLQEQDFIDILEDELILAMGCTEPSAIAYCSASAVSLLGNLPEEMSVTVSGNMIKNAKSVVVPNTDGMKGIPAAAAAGVYAGAPEKKLEILSALTDETRREAQEYLEQHEIPVKLYPGKEKLYIRVDVRSRDQSAVCAIADHHTNIVYEERNGKVLRGHLQDGSEESVLQSAEQPSGNTSGEKDRCQKAAGDTKEGQSSRRRPSLDARKRCLSVRNILDFAGSVSIEAVKPVLDPQIACNTRIAREGMKNSWGANIGKTILTSCGNAVRNRAKAYAAAGSDARMSGCEMPVVINSGSGNQGITVSVPVIVYGEELGVSKDMIYRALLVSNLISVHIKTGIGALSAFCGAVSAGCAAACGIAYLHDGSYECISSTLTNSLATSSGIICDGAKPSCASKIAISVESGLLGYDMYCRGNNFQGGDGIVGTGVESTISNVSDIGAEGMNVTDQEILKIMTQEP